MTALVNACGAAPDSAAPWSFDRRDGALQGPLELRTFAGVGLRLQLAGGQTALATLAGAPLLAWREGEHQLRVGAGANEVPAEARLFMIAVDVPLRCRWEDATARGRDEAGPATAGAARSATARGVCEFLVTDPARFYLAFLRGAETAGADFVRRLLAALVQARLAESRAGAGGDAGAGRQDPAALPAGDLADGWDELGVALVSCACNAPRPAGQPVPASV